MKNQYDYPFILPESFLKYDSRTECFLKLQLIKCISVQNLKKVFPLSEFLGQLKLPNSKIIKVKKYLLFLIQEINNQGIIESKIEIIRKNGSIKQLQQTELKVNHLNRRVRFVVFYERIGILIRLLAGFKSR